MASTAIVSLALVVGSEPSSGVAQAVDWPVIFQGGILALCAMTYWEVRQHGKAIAVLESEGRERAHAVMNLRQDVQSLQHEFAEVLRCSNYRPRNGEAKTP